MLEELDRAYKIGQEAWFRSAVENKTPSNPYHDKALAVAWYRGFCGQPKAISIND